MPTLEKIILPLDGMTKEQAWNYLSEHKQYVQFVKVGMELFYRYGPDIVHQISNEFETKIFLDLKLHDIPNTITGAIKSLQGLPIDLLTVHLQGGEKMLEAAVTSRNKFLPRSKIIGVSFLTSLSSESLKTLWNTNDQGLADTLKKMIVQAEQNNLDGIVCSPLELEFLQSIPNSSSLLKICPGVRFSDQLNQESDQTRIATPQQALKWGADYLVIGRPLTKDPSPQLRWQQLKQLNI